MIYFLNKGLILEQAIVAALQTYFRSMGVENLYKYYTLNITNEHPFAILLMNSGENNESGLFPAIVVSSATDGHSPNNGHPLLEIEGLTLDPPDIDILNDHGYKVDKEVVEKLREEFTESEREHLYGITYITRRSERISIEIWCENIQLKNLLYEDVRLFITGGLHDCLAQYVEKNGLVIFDDTVDGQRSGTFSDSYGIKLAGANISFNADYMIEQSIIDTDLNKNGSINLEVDYGYKK